MFHNKKQAELKRQKEQAEMEAERLRQADDDRKLREELKSVAISAAIKPEIANNADNVPKPVDDVTERDADEVANKSQPTTSKPAFVQVLSNEDEAEFEKFLEDAT